MIRAIKQNDAGEVAAIYNYYIENTTVTFEESPVSAEVMAQRIESHNPELPWIVYEEDNEIIGYAYVSEWKSRCAYRFSVEGTVYLKHGKTGKGIGTRLYKELIRRLDKDKIHVVIGGIALPNEASIALHTKLGFEKVAQFKEVGFKFNKWVDVGYWELIIRKHSL